MLFPKKVKHRKWQSARRNPAKRGIATRGTTLAFGAYGLKADTSARVTSNQIESARKVLSRGVKKVGRMWIRIFPDRPYTSKAGDMPMGKGKGDPKGFCFEVRPGRVLFEVEGVDRVTARELMRKAGAKMPVKTRFVERT